MTYMSRNMSETPLVAFSRQSSKITVLLVKAACLGTRDVFHFHISSSDKTVDIRTVAIDVAKAMIHVSRDQSPALVSWKNSVLNVAAVISHTFYSRITLAHLHTVT